MMAEAAEDIDGMLIFLAARERSFYPSDHVNIAFN
jgi:hypothetical protein